MADNSFSVRNRTVNCPVLIPLIRSYTWGLDKEGVRPGAGGVGGLLQVTDHATSKTYYALSDYLGNVIGLVDASNGSVAAAYDGARQRGDGQASLARRAKATGCPPGGRLRQFDPFGRELRATGAYADQNPFRFSSQYTDNETGLVYFGFRYYHPEWGRFLNRDPIEEAGGENLYRFVSNDPVNRWDLLGLADIQLIHRDDPSHYGGTLLPSGSPHFTSVNVHGAPGGRGFYSHADERGRGVRVDSSTITDRIVSHGHTEGNPIRAYICFGGVGDNRAYFRDLSRQLSSPIIAATGPVVPREFRSQSAFDVPTGRYAGSEVRGGRWIVINPDGSIRDYGTDQNASRAERRADNLENRADTARARAVSARQTANEARAASDENPGSRRLESRAASRERTADSRESRAEAMEERASDAREEADTLRNEADNPL